MKKVKFPTVVGQETVAINDLKILIYTYFWLNCNRELFIIMMNVNRNSHTLVYTFITYLSFSIIIILKRLVHYDWGAPCQERRWGVGELEGSYYGERY